jgi:hypothetical protein
MIEITDQAAFLAFLTENHTRPLHPMLEDEAPREYPLESYRFEILDFSEDTTQRFTIDTHIHQGINTNTPKLPLNIEGELVPPHGGYCKCKKTRDKSQYVGLGCPNPGRPLEIIKTPKQ